MGFTRKDANGILVTGELLAVVGIVFMDGCCWFGFSLTEPCSLEAGDHPRLAGFAEIWSYPWRVDRSVGGWIDEDSDSVPKQGLRKE